MVDDLDRLYAAYTAATGEVRARLAQYSAGLWASLGDNYRSSVQEEFLEQLLPRVLAGQELLADLTGEYLNGCATILGLQMPTPPGELYERIRQGVRGVPVDEVYTRPFTTVYTKLKNGETLPAAVAAGGLKLDRILGTDLQIVKRDATHAGMSQWDKHPTGQTVFYQRVLKGSKNCALCIVASTQRYRVDHVQPIHPGCDCGFKPLPPGEYDHVLHPDRLEAIHAQIKEADKLPNSKRGAQWYENYIYQSKSDEWGETFSLLTRTDK